MDKMRISKIRFVEPDEALFITHSGVFHGDDVMGAAIISMRYGGKEKEKELLMARVPSSDMIPKDNPLGIVFDIGGGKFDHHQKGGNGERENGVPFASAGLLWKVFSKVIVINFLTDNGMSENLEFVEKVCSKVDFSLIQGIDAQDCGVLPQLDYPTQGVSVSMAIKGFNPVYGESDSELSFNNKFKEAVEFAKIVLHNEIRSAVASASAEYEVIRLIEKSDGKILELKGSLPWMGVIFNPTEEIEKKANSLLYAIFPGLRGGWNWRAIPTSNVKGSPFRNPTPYSWCGLSGGVLRVECKVGDATFVHPSGFMGGAETKEGVIKMIEKMIAFRE